MPTKKSSLLAFAVIALLGLAPRYSHAMVLTTIEPIVGYERTQKLVPNPHSHDHLIYGARFTAGLLLFAVEAEYLHGVDQESFPALSTTDTEDKAKLGLRSTIHLLGLLQFYLRAGGQAERIVHQEVAGGVTTSTTQPVAYNPYAGAGLRFHLSRFVSLTGDLTTVFHNFPSMNNNEYQATASLAIEIP